MTLTRAKLDRMKEERLQTEVLIPLFTAMGFRDVYQYHGGPLEQGKDIVMWKQGELGDRINYGVIVKTKNITGKASGKSSAAEVHFQIDECFAQPYRDPVSGQKEHVNCCWVVSSKKIKKEALNSLGPILAKSNLEKSTAFINGDKLWRLIEQFLSEKTVMDKLHQVQKLLDEMSPHYRIIPRLGEQKIDISFQPKYPGAEREHPMKVSGRFVFPKTPEGQKKLEEVNRHFETGSPLTLTEEYIEDFKFPEILAPFFDQSDVKPKKIEIGAKQIPRPLWVRVGVECADGEEGFLDRVELRGIQVGTEEFTLANDEQAVPWKVRLTFNSKEKRLKFDCNVDYVNTNIKQLLEVLRFQNAFTKGGRFFIEHLDTGIRSPESFIQPGLSEAPDPWFVEIIEKLAFIQEKTKIPLIYTGRDIESEEIDKIFWTVEKIERGHVKLTGGYFTASVKKESAQKMIEAVEHRKPIAVTYEGEEFEDIFGVQIPLGEVKLIADNLSIAPDDLEELKAVVKTAPSEEIIAVRLRPPNDSPIEARYSNWLSDEKADTSLTEPKNDECKS